MTDQCSSTTSTPAQWNSHGGFILLIIGVFALFWAIAYVCEEYAVPSICVFCKRNHFSDDITGAVVIGGVLSLPVLFTSLITVFDSNTVGIGTVIGGDIFNLFVNIAVSIYVSPGKTIRMNGVVFSREMLMFFLSCIVVLWSIRDIQNSQAFVSLITTFQLTHWSRCLEIPWQESLTLVLSYVVYCLFTVFGATMLTRWIKSILLYFHCQDTHRGFLRILGEEEDQPEEESRPSDVFPAIELVVQNSLRPTRSDDYIDCEVSMMDNELLTLASRDGNDPSFSLSPRSQPSSLPVATIDLETSVQYEFQEYGLRYPHLLESFPMYIRSTFYSTHPQIAVCCSNPWKLRYFTFNEHGLFYKLDHSFTNYRQNPSVRYIDIFSIARISLEQESHFEFSLTIYSDVPESRNTNSNTNNSESTTNNNEARRRRPCKFYYFRAPDRTIYYAILHKLYWFWEKARTLHPDELEILQSKAKEFISSPIDEVVHVDDQSLGETLFSPQPNSSLISRAVFYLSLPLRYVCYWSIPDVRRQGSEHRAMQSLLVSGLWLALFSYGLAVTMSRLNDCLQLRDSLIGMSLGAWAVSYPALWSSLVLARNGFGQIAVYNAIGSNTFSNCVGLGLPWLLFGTITHSPQGALGVPEQGLAFANVVLLVAIVLLFVLTASNHFILSSWMIPILILMYLVFVSVFFVLTIEN